MTLIDGNCINNIDSEHIIIKYEEWNSMFAFDKVFYEESNKNDLYKFFAAPIVKDGFDGINGTILMYE